MIFVWLYCGEFGGLVWSGCVVVVLGWGCGYVLEFVWILGSLCLRCLRDVLCFNGDLVACWEFLCGARCFDCCVGFCYLLVW